MLTIAHAKPPGQPGVSKHAQAKHPANEWVLCHGDAVPAFPGQPPVGNEADRPNAPADVQADAADLSKVDTSVFTGHVETRHADQWMFSDRMFYQHDQDTWQALGKGLARTHPVATAKAASCNFDLHGSSLPGKITEDTPIDAVDAPRCGAAGRTLRGGRTGHRLDRDCVRSR